jgi:DNA-binding LacI/PurR family transcriptional regulator
MQYTQGTPASGDGGRTTVGLAGDLREMIASGRFAAGRFVPPVRELAKEHGAARVTVHRALKMLAGEGLLVACPRHGYRVVPGAGDPDRGLPVAYVNSTRHEVGSGRDEFHKTLLVEFQRVAGSRGWSLLVLDADALTPAAAAEQIAAANCCGAITNTVVPELWTRLSGTGLPAVVVDAWTKDLAGDSVVQDGFMGGLQAGGHLLDKGHSKIAWLGPELEAGNPQVLERFAGAHAALAARSLDFSTRATVPLGRPAEALEAARALLKGRSRPKAILALWQDVALAVARAAAELGLVVGRDFAMVGWCTEEEFAAGYAPAFGGRPVPATVTWSIARMADAAMARLKQRRAEPGLAPAMIRIPTAVREGVRK